MKAGVDVEMTTRVKRARTGSQYTHVACISIETPHTSCRIDKEHVESTTNESGQLTSPTESDTCKHLRQDFIDTVNVTAKSDGQY